MDRATFLSRCVAAGYCTRKQAKEYAKNKAVLSEADFVEVFRRYSGKIETCEKWSPAMNTPGHSPYKTTHSFDEAYD